MELLDAIDQLIRKGQIAEAWKRIQGFKPSDLSREQRLQLADYSRRAQEPLFALKVLNKVFKDHLEGIDQVTNDEVVTYSGCLTKLGLFREAESWIEHLGTSRHPEYFNLMARIQISCWDHSPAVKNLKTYLKSLDDQSYSHLVGSLNLCVSQITIGKFADAEKTLASIQHRAKQQEHQLILGNSFELLAQIQINKKEYEQARQSLETSQNLLGRRKNVWSFFTRKWELLIALNSSGWNSETQFLAENLKKEAVDGQYWEDVREVDRLISKFSENKDLLLKLYFGTRFQGYKNRLLKNFPQKITVPKEYVCPINQPDESSLTFDYKNDLEASPALKSLFLVLTKDLYRPLPLGFVFESLYSEEHFDPFHSPDRVYTLIKRLRSTLPEHLAASVEWDRSGIQLQFTKPVFLTLRDDAEYEPDEDMISKMRANFKKQWFNTAMASDFLNISASKALQLIQLSKKKYKMDSQGRGKSIRYRFR